MERLWPLYPACLGPEEGAHLAGWLLSPLSREGGVLTLGLGATVTR